MSKATPQNIAVVVAHPDDEVLAFGGAMARHSAKGDTVRILILSTGLSARGEANENSLSDLQNQARKAALVLGAEPPQFADFPDNKMDTVALLDVVQCIEKFFDSFPPDMVLTHHVGDLNVDHQIVFKAVLTAARPLPGRKSIHIYSGEILSSSEYAHSADRFVPNTYIDISECLDKKQKALACYAGELRDWPHPRSLKAVEHQAHVRGCEVGLDAAEALCLIRAVYP